MSAIRKSGKLDDHTTLIDIGMMGMYSIAAVYLIRGKKTCLIDGGTRTEAPRMIKALKELDAFPPDCILLTHPHYDHAQGVPRLRLEASRLGKKIEVLASPQAIPLLAEPSFNDIFEKGPYEKIQEVTAVKEGDVIDLGGVSLRIYDVPGHCQGHVAILDEQSRALFVGDALGNKMTDQIYLPPFMPPFWDPDAFLASVDKLKHIDHQAICLAHFGYLYGSEAASILDEAVDIYSVWWQLYEKNASRLDDTSALLHAMRKEIRIGVPEPQPISIGMRALLRIVSGVSSLLGQKAAVLDRLSFGEYITWLAEGYRAYKKSNMH
jgi:glyoxylase-like metal-dependent hydrolase (beta-lactamase superfamily II)